MFIFQTIQNHQIQNAGTTAHTKTRHMPHQLKVECIEFGVMKVEN